MFSQLKTAVMIRILAIFVMTHAGAAAVLFGLARQNSGFPGQLDPWVWIGLCLCVGSFWASLFFITSPIRKASDFKTRILTDLQTWIALIPAILSFIQTVRTLLQAVQPDVPAVKVALPKKRRTSKSQKRAA